LSLPNNNNLPPNFAQAALLLQNSSGVYSRKVEYLHTLVYQTLYSLIEQTNDPNNKHKSKSAGSAGSASSIQKKSSRQLRGDDDICLFQEFDSELQFLLLDDVLPIDVHGTRINLKQKDLIAEDDEGDTGVGAGTGAGAGPSTGTPNNTTLLNATRLSIGGVMIDENNSTDAATTATVVDVANTTSSNATLRLMNGACHIHIGTGALLMPGTQTTMNPLFNQNNNDNDDEGTNNAIIPMDISIEDAEKEDVIMNEIGNEENDGGGVVFDDCYDNNNDYGDDNDDGDDNGNGFVLHDKCGNHDNPIVSHIHHQTPECQDDQDKNTTPEIQDPWQMLLDPHDNSKFKKRPMKKGKTIRLPSECEDLPSDSVTGTRTKQIVQKKRKKKKNDLSYVCLKKEISEKVVKVESWDDCIATQSYKATIARVKEEVERRQSQHIHNNDDDCSTIVMDDVNERRISIMDPIPLKGHLFSNEFHYIAKEQMTQKTIENRKRNKTCDGYKDNMVVDSVAAAITNERFRDMYEGDDDGDDQEGLINFGFGGDDHGGDDSDDDDINGGGDFICDHNDNNLERGSDFDEVFANDGSNDKDGSNNNHATFEELCRAHLKEFAKDAENYAVETQLTKRVGDWQSKLANVLAEEEERPEFNIKTYGNNVLSTMKRRTEHKKGKVDKKTVSTFHLYHFKAKIDKFIVTVLP
jgi:condensin-2 complex subunit H2